MSVVKNSARYDHNNKIIWMWASTKCAPLRRVITFFVLFSFLGWFSYLWTSRLRQKNGCTDKKERRWWSTWVGSNTRRRRLGQTKRNHSSEHLLEVSNLYVLVFLAKQWFIMTHNYRLQILFYYCPSHFEHTWNNSLRIFVTFDSDS